MLNSGLEHQAYDGIYKKKRKNIVIRKVLVRTIKIFFFELGMFCVFVELPI